VGSRRRLGLRAGARRSRRRRREALIWRGRPASPATRAGQDRPGAEAKSPASRVGWGGATKLREGFVVFAPLFVVLEASSPAEESWVGSRLVRAPVGPPGHFIKSEICWRYHGQRQKPLLDAVV
jgi:hypothetical protein